MVTILCPVRRRRLTINVGLEGNEAQLHRPPPLGIFLYARCFRDALPLGAHRAKNFGAMLVHCWISYVHGHLMTTYTSIFVYDPAYLLEQDIHVVLLLRRAVGWQLGLEQEASRYA